MTFDNTVGLVTLALKNHAASSPALHHLLAELEPEWELFAMALRDEGLLVPDEETPEQAKLGVAADLLAALVPVPVSFEYPGFISVLLDPVRVVSIGDNGDKGEPLGFQLDDNEGRNLEAFEIDGITVDNTPAEIAEGCARVLQPYLAGKSEAS